MSHERGRHSHGTSSDYPCLGVIDPDGDFQVSNATDHDRNFRGLNVTKLVFDDIIEHFKKMEPRCRGLLSEVMKIFELVLVLPATNATSERSFSKIEVN